MAKIPNVAATDARPSSIADRLAFDPFTSKEEILNDLIKSIINPNIDTAKAYYIGYVCEIISSNDEEIEVRDIFYSPFENYKRISNPIGQATPEKKILLVHIPSFTTNGEINIGSKLNYNSFNKIRVEYDRTEPIKVGNVVKIQFRDKTSFYNPFVVDPPIDTSFQDIAPDTKKARDEFNKYLECKLLNIKVPTSAADIDFKELSNPAGGYAQGLEEINYVFSNSYIEAFKRTLSKQNVGEVDKIIIKAEKISLSTPVYIKFGQTKTYSSFSVTSTDPENFKGKPEFDILKKEYEIFCLGSDIKISGSDPKTIKNLFYKFIKKDFDVRLGFSFLFDENSTDNLFRVDLNLNQLLGTSVKKVEDYISISERLRESKSFYSFIKPPSPENSANPQILKSKTVADKCDSEAAKDKSVYKLVYQKGKFETEGTVSSQNQIIQQIFEGKIKPDSFLNLDYFYKLIGTTKEDAVNFIFTKNEDFYTKGGQTNDKYNLPKELKNTLSVYQLPGYFNIILKFLNQLRQLLIVNEAYRDYQDSIYIIPFNVLEIRKKQLLSTKDRDNNSRHFYGKAFDIMVFIRDEFYKNGQEKRVVQIPPEIVALYVDAVSKILELNYTIGQGIFLEKTSFYNHVEFIDQESGLKDEELVERILFTGATKEGGGTDLEKFIEKTPAGTARIEKLKEIVRQGSNYINPNTKQLDPRFEVLT